MDGKQLKEGLGKFKKIVGVIKKLLSKELLWFLIIALISSVLSLVLSYVIATYGSKDLKEVLRIIAGERPTYTAVFVLCSIGIYFSRMVFAAIETHFTKPKES